MAVGGFQNNVCLDANVPGHKCTRHVSDKRVHDIQLSSLGCGGNITLHGVQCALHYGLYSLYTVLWAIFTVNCTTGYIHCTPYSGENCINNLPDHVPAILHNLYDIIFVNTI